MQKAVSFREMMRSSLKNKTSSLREDYSFFNSYRFFLKMQDSSFKKRKTFRKKDQSSFKMDGIFLKKHEAFS